MNHPPPKPGNRRDEILPFVLYVLIVGCLGAFFKAFSERFAWSILLMMAMAGGLAASPPWVAWVRGLGRLRLALFAGFVGAMLLAQFSHSYRYFPFYLWGMYTHAPVREEVSHNELRATLVDGSTVVLNPERLLQHRMDYAISVWLRRAEASPSGAVGANFNKVLAALAEAHARYGEGPPVHRIDVVRLFHPVRPGVVKEREPEAVWRWEVAR